MNLVTPPIVQDVWLLTVVRDVVLLALVASVRASEQKQQRQRYGAPQPPNDAQVGFRALRIRSSAEQRARKLEHGGESG